jgi:hypothetical protein
MAGHQRGRRGSYPNLVWKAIATGTTFIGVGETVAGDQSAGEAVQLTVAWVRTVRLCHLHEGR